MKKILYILLCFGALKAGAQTISPQVINSAGSHRAAGNGITITDNVGETFVQTLGPSGINNLMITEGYLQPFVITPGFSVTLTKSDLTCSDKKDGKISVAISTVYQYYTATYSWTPASACPQNNCQTLDSLNPGTYSVAIHITYTTSAGLVRQDSSFKSAIVSDLVGPCMIDIHTGFTPNGDGKNDAWIINKIDAFKSNKVSIFNRWGMEVYSTEKYDNISNVWKPDDKMPAGTYFYIIELGEGRALIKGWVELIKD